MFLGVLRNSRFHVLCVLICKALLWDTDQVSLLYRKASKITITKIICPIVICYYFKNKDVKLQFQLMNQCIHLDTWQVIADTTGNFTLKFHYNCTLQLWYFLPFLRRKDAFHFPWSLEHSCCRVSTIPKLQFQLDIIASKAIKLLLSYSVIQTQTVFHTINSNVFWRLDLKGRK